MTLTSLAAEAARGAAAIHRRVAAAEHDDAGGRSCWMCSKDTLESQSMPMWILGAFFLAAGDVEVAPARGPCADEDRVEPLVDDGLEAIDALAEARIDPSHTDDVADLFVDGRLGQTEAGNLACK